MLDWWMDSFGHRLDITTTVSVSERLENYRDAQDRLAESERILAESDVQLRGRDFLYIAKGTLRNAFWDVLSMYVLRGNVYILFERYCACFVWEVLCLYYVQSERYCACSVWEVLCLYYVVWEVLCMFCLRGTLSVLSTVWEVLCMFRLRGTLSVLCTVSEVLCVGCSRGSMYVLSESTVYVLCSVWEYCVCTLYCLRVLCMYYVLSESTVYVLCTVWE